MDQTGRSKRRRAFSGRIVGRTASLNGAAAESHTLRRCYSVGGSEPTRILSCSRLFAYRISSGEKYVGDQPKIAVETFRDVRRMNQHGELRVLPRRGCICRDTAQIGNVGPTAVLVGIRRAYLTLKPSPPGSPAPTPVAPEGKGTIKPRSEQACRNGRMRAALG